MIRTVRINGNGHVEMTLTELRRLLYEAYCDGYVKARWNPEDMTLRTPKPDPYNFAHSVCSSDVTVYTNDEYGGVIYDPRYGIG